MDKIFTKDEVAVMQRVRAGLNPSGRLSPGKMLPTAGGCGMEHKPPVQVKPGRRAAL